MLKPIKLANKNFLSSLDNSSEEFFHILEIAKNFKNKDLNIELKHKVLGLIFDKSSTISFLNAYSYSFRFEIASSNFYLFALLFSKIIERRSWMPLICYSCASAFDLRSSWKVFYSFKRFCLKLSIAWTVLSSFAFSNS